MKKILILLLLLPLPLFFACTDSNSPSEEKKVEKSAPEKTDPPACDDSTPCPAGKVCNNGNCVECACAADCKDGYTCFENNICGCGAPGHECSEGQICVNGNCEYPTVGLGESCDATHPCAAGLSCSSDGKCE